MIKQCRLSGRNSRLIYAIACKNTATECIKLCRAVKYKAATVSGREKKHSGKRLITIARRGTRRRRLTAAKQPVGFFLILFGDQFSVSNNLTINQERCRLM